MKECRHPGNSEGMIIIMDRQIQSAQEKDVEAKGAG